MPATVTNLGRKFKSEVQVGVEASIGAIQDKLQEIQIQLSVLSSSFPAHADRSEQDSTGLSGRIAALVDALTVLQVEFSTHASLCGAKWEQNEDSEKTQDQVLVAMQDKQQVHDVTLQVMASRISESANKIEVIETADATDLESALVLVNELKVKLNSMQ